MRKRLLPVAILFCCCGSAVAQDLQKVELFGGYSYQRFEGINLHGWNAAVMANIKSWFAIGADFTGTYNNFQRLGVDVGANIHSAMFGPQFSRRNNKVRIFGRALMGVTRGSAIAKLEPAIGFATRSAALMFGGGLDIRLSKNFAARVFQADYHTAWAEHGRGDGLRLATGLVVLFH